MEQPAGNPTQSMRDRLAFAYEQWHKTLGGTPHLFTDLMSEDVELSSVLDNELLDDLAPNRSGHEKAVEYFQLIGKNWEMIEFPTDRIVSDDHTVVWIGSCAWRHRKTGQVIATPKVDVWTVGDGKATSLVEYFDSLGYARTAGML